MPRQVVAALVAAEGAGVSKEDPTFPEIAKMNYAQIFKRSMDRSFRMGGDGVHHTDGFEQFVKTNTFDPRCGSLSYASRPWDCAYCGRHRHPSDLGKRSCERCGAS